MMVELVESQGGNKSDTFCGDIFIFYSQSQRFLISRG